MSFEKSFCPSPWISMRINPSGDFELCRWQNRKSKSIKYKNISECNPVDFFQQDPAMKQFRLDLLNGVERPECLDCDDMDRHGKVSGRARQLLKTGIMLDHFENSLISSPWFEVFKYSAENNGETIQYPLDWQVDLGNFCNSACVFCSPDYSSRLASEWKKLGFISELPKNSWCYDEKLLDNFVEMLLKTNNLQYLHFIGGETLLIPAFKNILEKLNQTGLSKRVTIGFTTNVTVWDQEINELLAGFQQVNLGLSIEALHPVNDYARYPSNIETITDILNKWVELSKKLGWLTQIRTTPSLLTIQHLLTIYDYAFENKLSVESCNFIYRPDFLKPSVLPAKLRETVINKMRIWIDNHCINDNLDITVVNTRNQDFYVQQMIQDLESYIHYLKVEPDETHLIPNLVEFLKKLEANRNNSILDYIPEYEEFLRIAGY
jgi:MoaA/NifB/PqqE/SkfB family radical SAM enzyme